MTATLRHWGLLLVLVVGCARRDLSAEALVAFLEGLDEGWAADALLNDRLPEGIDVQRLEDDLGRVGQHGAQWRGAMALQWRQARVLTALGVAASDPVVARRWWARARAIAVDCATAGKGLSTDVWLEVELHAERVRCALWAAEAWTRWVGTWEPESVEIDLERIDRVLARLEGHEGASGSPRLQAARRRLRRIPGPPPSEETLPQRRLPTRPG